MTDNILFTNKRKLVGWLSAITIVVVTISFAAVIYLNRSMEQLSTALYQDVFLNAELILNADRDLYPFYLAEKLLLHDDLTTELQPSDTKELLQNAQQIKERVLTVEEHIFARSLNLNSSKGDILLLRLHEQVKHFYIHMDNWMTASTPLLQKQYGLNDPQYIAKMNTMEDEFGQTRDSLEQAEDLIDLYAQEVNNMAESKSHSLFVMYSLLLLILTITIFLLGRKFFTTQNRLSEQQTLYSIMGDNMSDLILLTDQTGHIRYASPSHALVLGHLPEPSSHLDDYIRLTDLQRRQLFKLSPESPAFSMEVIMCDQEERWIWLEMKVSSIQVTRHMPAHLLLVSREITERKHYEDRLQHMAYFDAMTSIPNRANFTNYLENRFRIAEEEHGFLSLIMLDCDRFKQINDTLGHHAGDEYLIHLSAALQDTVSAYGQVFRIGGDEFAIVLYNLGSFPSMADLLEKLPAIFLTSWKIVDQEFFTTASMGIAIYPEDGTTMEALLKSADLAMYQSKKLGGNQITYFDNTLLEMAIKRTNLENDLHTALDKNELFLVYQSQINLRTGEIIGFEALLRWHHPLYGMIPPLDFIGIAEETGFIIQIGSWVLMEACKQNKAWSNAGHHFIMSVNLSSRQLHHPAILREVKDVLQITGLPPEQLTLEITESMVMNYTDETLDKLRQLKTLGVGISIDDFGTGYSSLSYLKKFPVDTIKIDKSFIQDLPGGLKDVSVVKAIIDMCHSLNMNLIAEGIETLEQIQCLREHQCDIVQGFFFGKPAPAAQFDQQLNAIRSKLPLIY